MPERAQWAHALGPTSGNLAFDEELQPPLRRVWAHTVWSDWGAGLCAGQANRIVVSFKKTDLHCLDSATGELLWAREGCRNPETPHAVVGSRVWTQFSATGRSGLAALSLETGETLASWEGRRSLPMGSFEDGERLCAAGYRADFRFLPEGIERVPRERALSGKLRQGLFMGLSAANQDEERGDWEGLLCYDAVGKNQVWFVPDANQNVKALSDTVAVLQPHSGKQVVVRSVDDGRELWSFESETAEANGASYALTGERVFHYDGLRAVARDLTTGQIVWTTEAPGARSSMLVTRSLIWQVIHLERGKQQLRALSQKTGESVWAQTIKGTLRCTPLCLIGGSLLFVIGGKLVCYREA